MSNEPTPQQILALPMQQPNDARAATIRDYLLTLLSRLWDEGETFSGKRPLGNSCWEYDLYAPLVRAGYITGAFEIYDGREGGLDECDHVAGDSLIEAAIKALGLPDEQPQDAQPGRDGDVRAVALGTEIATTERITSLLHDLDARTKERDEARDLACVSLDILRNVSDEPMRELYGVDDFGEMPEWFTRYRKPSAAALDARDAKGGE